MEKKQLGIGVIGAGLISAMHSFCLKTIADLGLLPVRLEHIVDLNIERAEAYSKFGYLRSSTDARAVIDDPGVDAVYVLTWTSEHRALVEAAAAAGKHVFCEKPLTFDAAGARAMADAVRRAGVVNQVGLVLRQAPVWNALRHLVATWRTGFPITVVFRDDQCFPIKGAHPSTWRRERDKCGAGTLIEHSIHDLDLLEWIFGNVVSVRAELGYRFGVEGVEDLARVDLEFDSGLSGILVSVWHDVLERHSNRLMEVFHERTYIRVEDEFNGAIQFMEGEGPMSELSAEKTHKIFCESRGIKDQKLIELTRTFGLYEDYLFCQGVLEGRCLGPDFGAAVRAHELVDACYESGRTGLRVSTGRPPQKVKEMA